LVWILHYYIQGEKMNTKIMVIDNNLITRETLKQRLGKVFGNQTIDESEIGVNTINEIYSSNPDVVLMNIILSEYDAAKTCVRFLSEDKRVNLLSLSRYDKTCVLIAIFDAGIGISNRDGASLTDIAFLLEKLYDDEDEQSAHYLGKYILKGSSLQCA